MNKSAVFLDPHIEKPIWSGNKLAALYPQFKDHEVIGEAWETSVEKGFDSKIRVHSRSASFREFLELSALPTPPLVKLLDTSSPLSVQVHPDAAVAEKYGGISKSEIWYVLDAVPDASILYGTLPGVTIEDVSDAIGNGGDIVSLLNRIPVRRGDVFMIPCGMIHSLGAGITVLEVQSCAGTTYRIKDLAGNRETHIPEACDSVRIYSREEAAALAFTRTPPEPFSPSISGDIIACTPEYTVIRYSANSASETLTVERSGVYMFCESGNGSCGDLSFTSGDSLYLGSKPHLITIENAASVIFVI